MKPLCIISLLLFGISVAQESRSSPNTKFFTGNNLLDTGIGFLGGLGAGFVGSNFLASLANSNNGGNNCNCVCNYNLTFQDKYGNTHGACRKADKTGRRWCYTNGNPCADSMPSSRYQNIYWSYQACGGQG